MPLARGFTLTELMVAMTISSAFVVSATSISVGHLKRQTVLQQKLALMEEVSLIKQAISVELRRAGFIYLPLSDYASFSAAALEFAKLHISEFPGEAPGSCILFSYDKNKNGQQNSASPAELLGFRLKDNTIEYRVAGRNCSQSGWHDLSTPEKITVSAFHIDGPYPATYGANYTISLSAYAADAPLLQRDLRFTVNVVNMPYD